MSRYFISAWICEASECKFIMLFFIGSGPVFLGSILEGEIKTALWLPINQCEINSRERAKNQPNKKPMGCSWLINAAFVCATLGARFFPLRSNPWTLAIKFIHPSALISQCKQQINVDTEPSFTESLPQKRCSNDTPWPYGERIFTKTRHDLIESHAKHDNFDASPKVRGLSLLWVLEIAGNDYE